MKKIRISSKSAITLVEICIGVVILSIVMAVVMNMFVSGIKGTNKGRAHLTNMQTAAIIMANIEYDLLRATKISDPVINIQEKEGRWEFVSKDGVVHTVMYQSLPNGIIREEQNGITGKKTNVFGKGLNFHLHFRHLAFVDPIKQVTKKGMWVELKVSSNKSDDEEFTINRIITCKNIKK